MRQGPNGRRPRGRPNRKQHGGPSRPNSYDSGGGPEGRVRGNAHQVYEKYVALARDALSAGDRVAAEGHYQHAEHYFRIVNSSTDPEPGDRRAPRGHAAGRDGNARDGNGQEPAAQSRLVPDARGQAADSAAPTRDRTPGDGETANGVNQDGQPSTAQPSTAQPSTPQPSTPQPSTPQPSAARRAAPRRAGEDRAGLDRVLGGEGRAPRRQRPPRPPETGTAADGVVPPDRRGNGQARDAAPDLGSGEAGQERVTQGTATGTATGPATGPATRTEPAEPSKERTDGRAPGDKKNPDTEPAGA